MDLKNLIILNFLIKIEMPRKEFMSSFLNGGDFDDSM
jgi:hypothetical protein